ncbi:hypothetical protein CGCA056_v009164 [Colletotrichum aenigma]|uniref:uncharacterized protein n=1 Tax=Colletotrichum aenigma TaxID=1215731 RepID=UPI001872CA17|nr:uncharacterized protein CGCA056_v009164 [Colletotrichum aenigma]KAF5518969.1 hypothetical protein CGCA056_v009164 [Colletotrichum aenigma]
MLIYTQEDKILLAIEAIRSACAAGRKLSVLRAAKTYGVPKSSDSKGFPLRLSSVEDMANLLLLARNGKPVGKR